MGSSWQGNGRMHCSLICVNPDQVGQVWPHVKGTIKRAIDRGHCDWAALQSNLFRGLVLLWVIWDGEKIKGAVLTQLVGDACEIIACAGEDFREWIHLIDKIEAYARDEGMTTMRLIGRRGWVRVLRDYTPTLVMLEKQL